MAKPESRIKKLFFKGILILLIPFLFGLAELTLRIAEYGENIALTVPYDRNPDYLQINPLLSLRYFSSREFAAFPQTDLFLKKKNTNTFRIVVQGESTAAGFPYAHGCSFPRIIEHQLQMKFPQKEIEVINISLAATNSYTLFDLRKEITELNPDVILINVGHNEFYGALGVGSTQSIGNSRLLILGYLKLKQFKLIQLLRNIIQKGILVKQDTDQEQSATLMSKMVKEKKIEINSPIYVRAEDQFRKNLKSLLAYYQNHNIPVIISNLVSNYKDQKPLSWLTDLNSSNEALVNYNLGKDQLNELDSLNAKDNFTLAKELDELRFRAPEKYNLIIAEEADQSGAYIIDMNSVFENHSKYGIIGNELLVEHVHPNLSGYKLMASHFLLKLEEMSPINKWDNSSSVLAESSEYLITEVDSLYGALLIHRLKSNWPFKPERIYSDSLLINYTPNEVPDQLAFELYRGKMQWAEATNKLYYYYSSTNQHQKALLTAQALSQEYNKIEEPLLMSAQSAMTLRKYNLALYYLKQANTISESDRTNFLVYVIYLEQNMYPEALAVIQKIKDPSKQGFAKAQIDALTILINENVAEEGNKYSQLEVAKQLIVLNKIDSAKKLLSDWLMDHPKDSLARKLLLQIER